MSALPLKFSMPKALSEPVKKALYFYPDVLDYDFNQEQYKTAWQMLKREKGGYLAVERGQLVRVSWFRYQFERFKGWFYFDNECHWAKVQMAAQKLAYFGYLNGFNQNGVLDVISDWDVKFQPTQLFTNECKKPRSKSSSTILQDLLVTFYKTNSLHLNRLQTQRDLQLAQSDDFRFGDTYYRSKDFVPMFNLDVQNEVLIQHVCNGISKNNYVFYAEKTLENSVFRTECINFRLSEIQKQYIRCNEMVKQQSSSQSLSTRVSNIISLSFNRSKLPPLDLLEKLHNEVVALGKLDVGCKRRHIQFFINLKLDLIEQQPTQKITHYRAFYQLISEDCPPPTCYEYMRDYFLEQDGFNILDLQSDFVQKWGEYLFSVPMDSAFENKYRYQLAQIRPDLILEDSLPRYIDRCLAVPDYSLAMKLIERLFACNTKNIRVFSYLDRCESLQTLLVQNSSLSKAYAVNMLEPSTRFSSSIFSAKKRHYQAAVLHSDIFYQEAAPHFFRDYVQEERWTEASALLERRQAAGLPLKNIAVEDRKKFADHLIDEGEDFYNSGKGYLANDLSKAEQLYRDSLAKMERAAQVESDEKYLYQVKVHRRLLAQVLIKQNKLQDALKILESIESIACSETDDYFAECYIGALEKRIAVLHNACLGAKFGDYISASKEHKDSCQESLDELLSRIDRVIKLREEYDLDEKKGEQLAALYFLKAECIDYFQLQGDAIFCYRTACELMPKQPFYHLRLAETLTAFDSGEADESRDRGIALLANCGINAHNFRYWFDERWSKETDKIFKVSIPAIPKEPEAESYFSFH